MRRDLAGMWTQFLSVFLMAFLGIFIYVGMEGTWFGMGTELNSYFAQTNLASAWFYDNGITDSDLQKIKNVSGITDATLSGLLSAKVKLPGVSSTKDEATQAILKKCDLTTKRFVTLLKKLPDSMLSQSVGGFSLVTLQQTSVDYNMIRIRTDGNVSTKVVEQKARDILGK